MRARHRMIRRTGALALGALFALTGCGPIEDTAAPLESGTPATSGPATSAAAPTPSASPKPTTSPTNPASGNGGGTSTTKPCPLGSQHKAVEIALAKIGTYGAIVVDGAQTAADCETIKRFQKRMGISPASGNAGTTTGKVAARIAATNPAACNAGTATRACVDLTHQTFYIMKGGQVVLGPTVTRTGMSGFATTPGTYGINDRSLKHWSRPYKVWLPYWQHFNDGMGLHETTTYIHNSSVGSHGCVNLLHNDAVKAYSLLGYNSKVKLYGRRPGT